MNTISLSLLSLAGAVLAVASLSPARADEPSARELIALAPILNSSDGGCRSLDVGGWFGEDEALAPKLRFRALYKAPNRFCLLWSDAEDDTPLAFCSDKRMFLYDPVGPTVYYSEDAGFTLELACTNSKLKFLINSNMRTNKKNMIFIDLRSVMLGDGQVEMSRAFEDRILRSSMGKYEIVRLLKNLPYVNLNIDINKKCPYTKFSLSYDNKTFFCLDRIVLNGAPGEESFVFPTKRRLFRELPVRDVTADENWEVNVNLAKVIGRAAVVRAVVNKPRTLKPTNIPGITGVDWDRVRENDMKFSKSLKELIPPSLREINTKRGRG